MINISFKAEDTQIKMGASPFTFKLIVICTIVIFSIFLYITQVLLSSRIINAKHKNDQDSLESRIKKRAIKSFLQEQEILQDEDYMDRPLTATLLQPFLTSTPYPTLTTEKQLHPQTPSIQAVQNQIQNAASKNYPHITDWSDVPPHLLIDRYYSGNFSYLNPTLCSRKGNLSLIILITTAIDHFQHRNNVRLTWGSYGKRSDVQYAFVVGDGLLHTLNESVQSLFTKEVELYDDFIIASMSDTYRRLSLKSLHMLDWVSSYCDGAKYYLKTDDDIFLNVPGILNFIEKNEKEDEQVPKIYGHVFSGHYPKRDVTHKHHLKYDIYPHNVSYPNLTSGPAYLMSVGIVRPLFEEAMKLPFIPLEDVLITGFAAMNLNIPRVDVPGFINEIHNPVDLPSCQLIKVLAGMSDGSAIQMNYLWYKYLMGRALCIWGNNNDEDIN